MSNKMFIDALNEENDALTKSYFLESPTGILQGRKVLDLTYNTPSMWKFNPTTPEPQHMRDMKKLMVRAGAEGTVDQEGNCTLKAKIDIEWGGSKNSEQEKTKPQESSNNTPDSTDREGSKNRQ